MKTNFRKSFIRKGAEEFVIKKVRIWPETPKIKIKSTDLEGFRNKDIIYIEK